LLRARSEVLVIFVGSIRLATKNGTRDSAGRPRDDGRNLGYGICRFGGGDRAKAGRLVEIGTHFWPGKTGWKLASMGGLSEEDLGREKCRGVDSPEVAIGCLTPVGTSDAAETQQSVSWPRSCSGARLKISLQFHSGRNT